MAEISAVPTVPNSGRTLDDHLVDDKDKINDTQHVELGDEEGLENVKAELVTEDANKAENFEHEMTTWQAFKIYKFVSGPDVDRGFN